MKLWSYSFIHFKFYDIGIIYVDDIEKFLFEYMWTLKLLENEAWLFKRHHRDMRNKNFHLPIIAYNCASYEIVKRLCENPEEEKPVSCA